VTKHVPTGSAAAAVNILNAAGIRWRTLAAASI